MSSRLYHFPGITSVLLLFTFAVCQDQEWHSNVPDTCPTNRTVIRQDKVSGNITIGQVDQDTVLTNILTAPQQGTLLTEYYINTSGLYLQSLPIPQDGTITQIRAFGYPNDATLSQLDIGTTENTNIVHSTLAVAVYRPDAQEDVYKLVHGPAAITHEFMPGVLPTPNWLVKKGDRVGTIIPRACTNTSNRVMCPSQVNLRTKSGDCLSAWYANGTVNRTGNMDQISLAEFQEVSVRLNVEVTISTRDESLNSAIIVGVVIGAVIVLSITVTVIVLAISTLLYRRRKRVVIRPSLVMSDDDLHIYLEPEDDSTVQFMNPFSTLNFELDQHAASPLNDDAAATRDSSEEASEATITQSAEMEADDGSEEKCDLLVNYGALENMEETGKQT